MILVQAGNPVLVKPVREVVVIVFRMDCSDVGLSGITGNMLFVRDCGCSDDDKLADNLVGYIKLIVDIVNFDLRLFSFVVVFSYVLKQTLECTDIQLLNYILRYWKSRTNEETFLLFYT